MEHAAHETIRLLGLPPDQLCFQRFEEGLDDGVITTGLRLAGVVVWQILTRLPYCTARDQLEPNVTRSLNGFALQACQHHLGRDLS